MSLSSSGIPCFSIHATCLSFLVALEVVSSLIHSGAYKNAVIVSSELICQYALDFKVDPYTAALFGDAAVACVITATPLGEESALKLFRMETFGNLNDLATLRGGGSMWHPLDPKTTKSHNTFKMDGPKIMEFATEYIPQFMERFQPGLSEGLGSIVCVIAHQPSGHGMSYLQHGLGWHDKVIRIFDTYGNGISSSIPNALFEAIKNGKIKRGQEILLCGTGSGLSLAGALLIY